MQLHAMCFTVKVLLKKYCMLIANVDNHNINKIIFLLNSV